MPCSDGREAEDREDNRHMRLGAEALCTWMRILEKNLTLDQATQSIPAVVVSWWIEHKERDASR